MCVFSVEYSDVGVGECVVADVLSVAGVHVGVHADESASYDLCEEWCVVLHDCVCEFCSCELREFLVCLVDEVDAFEVSGGVVGVDVCLHVDDVGCCARVSFKDFVVDGGSFEVSEEVYVSVFVGDDCEGLGADGASVEDAVEC